jgi:hypothetical protein
VTGRKVLLDENLPHQLRLHLPDHEAVTVAFAGMDGLKNGDLLKAAKAAGFDVFLTADQVFPHQQNRDGRKIAVVAFGSDWSVIGAQTRRISDAIMDARPGTISRVDCGTFSRRRTKPPALGPRQG